MERFRGVAVVLSTRDYGDSDRIVSLFSRERGYMSAFAAAARASKRRFQGKLEPTTVLTVELTSRGGELYRLTSAEVLEANHELRGDFVGLMRALYALELTRELVRDQAPHAELFDELIGFLGRGARHGAVALLGFELAALRAAGYMPRLLACVLCGRAIDDAPAFDPVRGGGICSQCVPRAASALPTSLGLLQRLEALQRGERVELNPQERASARRLVEAFIAQRLQRRLKSLELLAQVEEP